MAIIEQYVAYIATGALALAFVALIWLVVFEIRMRGLFRGSDDKSVAGVLESVKKELAGLHGGYQDIEEHLKTIDPLIRNSVKHVGVVRFDSFSDVGGRQSFAVALLDDRNNGVVLSSLYGRDVNRVYAKDITNGISQYKLTTEEEEAVTIALKS